MPDLDLAAAAAQFGAAGLIGWMWLSERRAAAARERQLAELHERLIQERPNLTLLLEVVRDNTRALTALEVGQRAIAAVLERVGSNKPCTRSAGLSRGYPSADRAGRAVL